MNNFGVIELASTKTTNAPGWAYVPDTTPHLAAAAAAAASLQTGNRKRAARNQAANTSALYADADARQEAKLRREIEALDRDNYHRDVSIPIVAKSTSNSKAAVKKHTPNVRKILQSQKTFANHLDDFEALSAQEKSNPNAANSGAGGAASVGAANTSGAGGSKKGSAAQAKSNNSNSSSNRKSSSKTKSRSTSVSKAAPAVKHEEDVPMTDAPPSSTDQAEPPQDPASSSSASSSSFLTPYTRPGYPPAHPQDSDPLLVSRVPPLPTDAELRALLAAPPLSYTEARGRWTADDEGAGRRYPARVFCEVCGYWGRVRCMRCGARVCALECLETHREECVTRYGL
ncbi:hypothetical protein F4811DRAFT_521783 [Daldinia bambusicola]|nr:hypothetical protein F4811DRAFT_521783 [Daldinia bambusicola]